LRIATVAVEAFFLIGTSLVLILQIGSGWRKHLAAACPSPIIGAWRITAVTTANADARPRSPEGQAWTVLYIEDRQSGFFRTIDGALWRCSFNINDAKRQLTISSVSGRSVYSWTAPDGAHLRLTRTFAKKPVAISLERIRTPAHYMLTERGFNWVNEWGYER
jgi:hypothetical protein